jgi:hypothetical protein
MLPLAYIIGSKLNWQNLVKSEGYENEIFKVEENMTKPSLNSQAQASTRSNLFFQ